MQYTKTQEKSFNDILKTLQENNALDNVILVGSWAEYIYEKENVLEGFASVAKTTDIDFLINDDKRNIKANNIIASATDKGFLYKEDYLTGVSKFFKDEFEVEFLIAQKGDGSRDIKKSSLGVKPQQLTHIGFVKNNYLTVEHNGLGINIPYPEAYVLQKMIINDRRKSKAEADRLKIDNMLPFLDNARFTNIYNQLFPKEKKKVDLYIKQYCPELKIQKDVANLFKEAQSPKNLTKSEARSMFAEVDNHKSQHNSSLRMK